MQLYLNRLWEEVIRNNPRAIYEYLLNNDTYKNYKFIWAFKDIDKYKRCVVLNNKRTQIVKYGSQNIIKHMELVNIG